MLGYGTTLTVGIGIPIPVLNEEICQCTAVKDDDIWTQIVDYSEDYPQGKKGSLGEVDYTQLKTGKIVIEGKEVPTGSLSSYFGNLTMFCRVTVMVVRDSSAYRIIA